MQQRIQNLDRLIHSAVDHKRIFGAVLQVESGDGRLSWSGAAGNMSSASRFFIASTTKLYVTAALLNLRGLNKIACTHIFKPMPPQKNLPLFMIRFSALSVTASLKAILCGMACPIKSKQLYSITYRIP